jgi:peptidoglycan/xylan/chitin deacetylase (PgdA/CDA1 family)
MLCKKLIIALSFFSFVSVQANDEGAHYFHQRCMEDMLKKMPKDEKFVALTFDDGPSRTTTPLILKVLQSRNVKATFFMLGEQAHKNSGLVEKVIQAGHELGNHTYSHLKLTRQPLEAIGKELQKTQEILTQYSEDVHWFRPPYGLVNANIHAKAAEMGMYTVTWTVDSRDWKKTSGETIKKRVLKDVHPGSVILFHDTKDRTAQALPQIIEALQNDGYEFVTMTEWLERVQKIRQAILDKKGSHNSKI